MSGDLIAIRAEQPGFSSDSLTRLDRCNRHSGKDSNYTCVKAIILLSKRLNTEDRWSACCNADPTSHVPSRQILALYSATQ
jgi:hypothetical protein